MATLTPTQQGGMDYLEENTQALCDYLVQHCGLHNGNAHAVEVATDHFQTALMWAKRAIESGRYKDGGAMPKAAASAGVEAEVKRDYSFVDTFVRCPESELINKAAEAVQDVLLSLCASHKALVVVQPGLYHSVVRACSSPKLPSSVFVSTSPMLTYSDGDGADFAILVGAFSLGELKDIVPKVLHGKTKLVVVGPPNALETMCGGNASKLIVRETRAL